MNKILNHVDFPQQPYKLQHLPHERCSLRRCGSVLQTKWKRELKANCGLIGNVCWFFFLARTVVFQNLIVAFPRDFWCGVSENLTRQSNGVVILDTTITQSHCELRWKVFFFGEVVENTTENST